MLFISVEDFFEKVSHISPLSREEELRYAQLMREGDPRAKEKLMEGYMPHVASVIRKMRSEYQTLELVFRCCTALEKAVEQFDFFQNGERFSHHLSWWLRQTTTRYIVEK